MQFPNKEQYQLITGIDIIRDRHLPRSDRNTRRLVELELEVALSQDGNALYKIIEKLVQQNPKSRLLLIADQFEELYTLCSEKQRQYFLDSLLTAVRLAPAFTLVMTLQRLLWICFILPPI